MKYVHATILVLGMLLCMQGAVAQKPFTEGVVSFRVELISADNTTVRGSYVFSIKDAEIKKELKLDNGYEDITLINCTKNSVYSLQNINGRKFAIQLSMDELLQKQQKFRGFRVVTEENTGKKMAGCTVYKTRIAYNDTAFSDILCTREWRPAQTITFNRFPDAPFFPLSFSYHEASGIIMKFDAEKMDAGPVASSVFRIPHEYKMISYEEYKQLSEE